MTPEEAAKVLALSAALDPRLRPPSESDAMVRARAWSAALAEGMTFAWASKAAIAHYAESADSIMPAHLNAAWRAHRKQVAEQAHSRTALEQVAGVPMPEPVREQLREILGRRVDG
jgi:hypothetical protein